MLYGLLITLYLIICFFLVLIILIQKTKSSMGLGGMSGSTQMFFGGSGGQDIFQKMTWTFITIFLAGSLVLAIMRSNLGQQSALLGTSAAAQSTTMPAAPSTQETEE